MLTALAYARRTKDAPDIQPSDFSENVTNKYYRLTPGKKSVYESKTKDGTETIEVYVTDEKKTVMGIGVTVVWDRVWENGSLIEDTKDWFAQDKNGDVWYFGEESKEMRNGQVVSTKGSWEAGVNGAQPGIVMKADPAPGQTYQQEYYKGEAEDAADVLAVGESVTVPFGTFTDCVQTLDYTPLEPNVREHKYYCSETGGLALEIDIPTQERGELISIAYDSAPSTSLGGDAIRARGTPLVSESRAKEIAIERVGGTVTDIETDTQSGKVIYVVEIDAENGIETDVIIDAQTGEILRVET